MAPKPTSQSPSAGGAGGFHQNVTAPMLGSLATGVFTTPPKATGGKTPAAKGGKPAAAPTPSAEEEVPAKLPLIAAINGLGGPQVLLAATDLKLVTSEFPHGDGKTPSGENRFIQGLEGKVSTAVKPLVKRPNGTPIPISLAKNNSFRIRWDFVPGSVAVAADPAKGVLAKPAVLGKGLHVNAEYGIGTGDALKTKIAFVPQGVGPVVDKPDQRNGVRFDQIVGDMSHFLGYDTSVNPIGVVRTVEERLNGRAPAWPEKPTEAQKKEEAGRMKTPGDFGKVMEAAARKLAERWAEMCKEGREDGLGDQVAGAAKANAEEKRKVDEEEAGKKAAGGAGAAAGGAAAEQKARR